MSEKTFAIRFTREPRLYITYDRETFLATGYGYCCGCRETKQFPTKSAAEGAFKAMELSPKNHEVIDSETAAKEKRKAARKKPVTAMEIY